ncbi:MAG: hypothetical protein ACYDHW_04085 [Syntrophorhabdaceae bacterium]
MAGISWWREKTKWPPDLHNTIYYELYDLKRNGLSGVWWAKTIDRLWDWRAIRPLKKNAIKVRGLKLLPTLQEKYLDICAKTQDEPSFLDFEWNQIADFYNILANIKASNSPVFPSKLGHFIFPRLFIVMDNKATGAYNYQICWHSMKESWNDFDDKKEARDILAEEITKYSLKNIHPYYPFEIKIFELCSIANNLDNRLFNLKENSEQSSLTLTDGQFQKVKEMVQMDDMRKDINADYNEINFKTFIKWLSENLSNPKDFFTLAQKKPFSARYNTQDGSITIVNSRGNFATLKNMDIRMIFERWRSSPEQSKYITKNYGLGNWEECPHRDAPAIPVIIKYWINNNKNS